MSYPRKLRSVPLLAALALFLAACGGTAAEVSPPLADDNVATTVAEEHSDDEATNGDDDAAHSDDEADHDEVFTFGVPADAADADRVIEIAAYDDFTFEPEAITVTAGETVTFVVTNVGNLPHDFTLGDEETQDVHEAEMAEMAGMAAADMAHADPNAVVVAAGETAELTWHFSEAGTFLMGCHQPGHYAAGMKGVVQVDV